MLIRRLSSNPSPIPIPIPVLARISGLPAAAIDQLSSDLCSEWLEAAPLLERELEATRAELVDSIHKLVPLSSPGLRHFLLAVKRDAFNGRTLGRHREDSRWSELTRLTGPVAERARDLEDRLESWREGFATVYRRQRTREHQALLAALKAPGFLRGLTLASPVLAEAAGRFGRTRSQADATQGRRESRLDLGLARYVSRAAVKLSPFSTLTRMALGTISREAADPFAWTGGPWRERSLLRLRRYLIEQDLALLCRHRPFRESLELVLNPTLEEVSPERYRFLRPERWKPDATAGRLRHQSASLVEIKLAGILIARVLGACAEPCAYRYGELVAILEEELGGVEPVENATLAASTLDALIEAGVLLLAPPWPSNEPHLEKRLLTYLRALPDDGRLKPVVEALDRLVALEDGFPETAEPVRTVAEIDRTLDSLWQAAVPLAGLEPGMERYRIRAGDVSEDVLLTSTEGTFQVSSAAIREIVRSAEPWARILAFQGSRLDFLHTVAALMRRRWPDRREVSFLELFGESQPMWREYRQYTAARAEAWASAFNPLDLAEVSALARLRAEIWQGLTEALRVCPAGGILPSGVLEGLAARIPERYTLPLGACLFVQPADPEGRLWVLNRVFEGTGRYGSRFTAVMDEESRRCYTDPYVVAATREVDGEPADLLDLMWSQGDTLNIHAAQTARVLAIPGETLDREGAEPVSLRDLRVHLDEAARLPRLTDAAGRRVLPAHLGGTASHRMPFLIQFLAQWGPGEIRPPRPPVPARREGAVQILERLTAGCLVLARRRWVVSLGEELRRRVEAGTREDAFALLNRWRGEQGLPHRLFWIEKTHYEGLGELYKPQYLDLTSPLFAEVFRSALRLNGDPLTFEETLPELGGLPRGQGGERWAVELQLDTLPLGPGDLPGERSAESVTSQVSFPSAVGGRSVQPRAQGLNLKGENTWN